MDEMKLTAVEQGRAIGAGTLDPVALTEAYLAAIEAHPSANRIYVRVTAERARAEAAAAAARAKAGVRRSVLDGVPVSWKDLFDTAGTETEAGTLLRKEHLPEADAEVLRNGTAAGLVCLGKTHMSEIAFSGLGINPKAETSPNIHDPDAAPGGSSSGAGASVAFGLAAAAVGSDTGGSVRIPSAWNDLVGMKTTHGWLSLDGVVPLAETFDTVGSLVRSVEDAAHMTAALAGAQVPDLGAASLKGVRLGVVTSVLMEGLAPEVLETFTEARARLEAAGANIVELEAPEVPEALELAGPLVTADAWAYWGDEITVNPEAMFHQVRERIAPGGEVSAAEFLRAWKALKDTRARFEARIAGLDAVLSPTVAIRPPKVAPLLSDDAAYVETNLMALRNTRVFNLLGGCSLTLPTGTPGVGVMLSAAGGHDWRLLRLGAAAEAVVKR